MRFLFLIPIVLSGLFLPLWAFLGMVFLYGLFFPSGILLVVAVGVDALFGNPDTGFSYIYTLYTALLLAVISIMKPYLTIYR